MTDRGKHTEKDIRAHNEERRTHIRMMRGTYTYSELERYFGVNRKYLWHIVNDDTYEPTGEVARKLDWIVTNKFKCPDCGVVYIERKPPPKRSYKRTPGGWVNAKDPEKAAKQLAKRAEYTLNELISAINELLEDNNEM